jgi:hypothetical protein
MVAKNALFSHLIALEDENVSLAVNKYCQQCLHWMTMTVMTPFFLTQKKKKVSQSTFETGLYQ